MFFGRLAAPSSPTLSGEGYQAGYQQVWPVATAELPSTWLRCERCLGSRGEIRGVRIPPSAPGCRRDSDAVLPDDEVNAHTSHVESLRTRVGSDLGARRVERARGPHRLR